MRSTVQQDAITVRAGAHPGAAETMQPAELRWAGAALALGGLLFVAGVILGLRAFGGDWDTGTGPTLPRTATLIQEKWTEFSLIWSGELLGALLLALAALLLQRRPQERRRWLPAGVVWLCVGVGSLLVAVSYAVTLGGYPAALATFAEQPALFASLRGAALSVHTTGSVLQLLGLIGALVIEFRWHGRALPDRLVQAGAGVALLGFVAAVAGLIPGEYVAAGIFAAAAVLGAAIWLRGGKPAGRAQALRALAWAAAAAVTSLGTLATAVHAQSAQPILDMHMHIGVLSGWPARLAAWQAAAPDRFIPALQFDLARNADITPDSLRRLVDAARHHGRLPESPTQTAGRDTQAGVLAITRTNVVDVATGSILADRTILVREGWVVDVGASDSVSVPADATHVDGAGQYVVPGLWDAHVHSATNTEWHFPLFIAHGITSVRNMHTTVDTGLALTNALKRRIASGELPGPRFLANGGVVDGSPAVWPGSVAIENAEAARAAVDSLAAGGADFIKVYDRLTAHAFAGIMAAARARGIPVDGHVPMAVDPVFAASTGLRTVEHGTGIVMGCSARADSLRAAYEEHMRRAEADGGAAFFRLLQTARDTRDPAACDRTIRALVQHGVAVTPTLVDLIGPRILTDSATMRFMPAAVATRWTAMAPGGPDPFSEFLEAGRELRIANVRMMHEAGVTILAGTDVGNPFIVPGASLHHELELLVRDVGMSPLEALRTATLNPARAFGLADSLGVVAPGMRADLLLLRENPLDDIRNTRMIAGVVLNGRLFDRGELDALLEAAARGGR